MLTAGQHPGPRRDPQEIASEQLPEYLEVHAVAALIGASPNPKAQLLFRIKWWAGLRISEVLTVRPRDQSLDIDRRMIRVRQGKGNKAIVVHVHA